jgi:glycosyltransferase involved in cell wall biosynthesis
MVTTEIKMLSIEDGNTSLISIGLPIYNEAQYISRAIESWLVQDYPNFELIIVDNASNDGTVEICRKYSSKDKRIRLVENPHNIGVYRNHKLAFELSRGKYFMWAGGHDHVHPSFISKTAEVLNADENIVMCTTRSEFRDENDVCWRTTNGGLDLRNLPPHERFAGLLNHAVSGGTANIFYGLYRREILSQVVEFKKNIGADIALLMNVALLGEVTQLDDVLYYRFVPRDARKDNKRVRRHVRDIFGDSSFEVGAQLPTIGMLFGYLQVIDSSTLEPKHKQFMFDVINNEARRISQTLLNEFNVRGKDEILSLEEYPDFQRYRAVQLLETLNRARMFNLNSEAANQLYTDCSNILLAQKKKITVEKPNQRNFWNIFTKKKD